MTERQKLARQNLAEIVGYFRMVAQGCDWHPWRNSEYEVVQAVANLISAKNYFGEADFVAIASCVNRLAGQEHPNGSGWFDFQLRFNHFFATFGYESKWNPITGEFLFWK